MRMSERDRRDWSLLIFIVPLGILLMLIAGQFAMRVMPQWVLKVGMGSSLNVETAGGQQTVLEPLFNIGILTPFAWQNTYLTPNADSGFVFPPFVVLEPSATPTATALPPQTETRTATPPVTAPPTSTTTVTPSATAVVPPTKPGNTSTPNTSTPTATATTSTPIVTVTTGTPTATATTSTPTATATTDTPTATATTATPTATATTATPTATATTGTPPSATLVTPDLPIGTDTPDGVISNIPTASYVILNISGNPVIVLNTPDGNYDLILYDYLNGGVVYLDQIIVGISENADGSLYYEVYNWGNNIPDANTNVDITNLPPDPACAPNDECNNFEVTPTELYPNPGTGILIDVDNAPSSPPPATYSYIVIINPATVGGEPAQVDAIIVTEVPIPTATP